MKIIYHGDVHGYKNHRDVITTHYVKGLIDDHLFTVLLKHENYLNHRLTIYCQPYDATHRTGVLPIHTLYQKQYANYKQSLHCFNELVTHLDDYTQNNASTRTWFIHTDRLDALEQQLSQA